MANKLHVLELKICGKCGGLWLKPKESNAIYCAPCMEPRKRKAGRDGKE